MHTCICVSLYRYIYIYIFDDQVEGKVEEVITAVKEVTNKVQKLRSAHADKAKVNYTPISYTLLYISVN